jgi:hypothetical protein
MHTWSSDWKRVIIIIIIIIIPRTPAMDLIAPLRPAFAQQENTPCVVKAGLGIKVPINVVRHIEQALTQLRKTHPIW